MVIPIGCGARVGAYRAGPESSRPRVIPAAPAVTVGAYRADPVSNTAGSNTAASNVPLARSGSVMVTAAGASVGAYKARLASSRPSVSDWALPATWATSGAYSAGPVSNAVGSKLESNGPVARNGTVSDLVGNIRAGAYKARLASSRPSVSDWVGASLTATATSAQSSVVP